MESNKKKKELAFNELWEKWHMPVYKYCLHRLKDSQRAEDCMQNTFYTLYESLEKLDVKENIGSWLFRVANNFVLKEFRNIKREMKNTPIEDVAENWALGYEANLYEEVSDEQILELKDRLIKSISREDSLLIKLWYDEKKSVSEISEILGISESAVYKRRAVLCNKIKLLARKITENL